MSADCPGAGPSANLVDNALSLFQPPVLLCGLLPWQKDGFELQIWDRGPGHRPRPAFQALMPFQRLGRWPWRPWSLVDWVWRSPNGWPAPHGGELKLGRRCVAWGGEQGFWRQPSTGPLDRAAAGSKAPGG